MVRGRMRGANRKLRKVMLRENDNIVGVGEWEIMERWEEVVGLEEGCRDRARGEGWRGWRRQEGSRGGRMGEWEKGRKKKHSRAGERGHALSG